MYTNAGTKLSELEKGKWCLVRSHHALSPNSDDVQEPSHYLIKTDDEKVVILWVFATEETKLETIADWHEVIYPDAKIIHNDIFSYDKDLAKYSLDTLTVKELNDDVIEKMETLVHVLLFNRKRAKVLNSQFEEVSDLVYETEYKKDEIFKVFEEALAQTV